MSNPSQKQSVSFLGIVCNAFGHDFIVTRKVTNHINEYKCSNCGREVTDTFSGNIERLTSKTRHANSNLAAFFQKKMNRRITA